MAHFDNTNVTVKSKPTNSISIVIKISTFLLFTLVITVSYHGIVPYKPQTYMSSNEYMQATININSSIITHQQCNISEYEANIRKLMIGIRKSNIALQSIPIYYLELKKQIEDVVDNHIVGDIYETGIWKGGTAIFMTYVMNAYEKCKGIKSDRQFWYFDSFEGFAGTNKDGDKTLTNYLSADRYIAPLDSVKNNFKQFVELNDNIHFVKGYFEETIPKHCNSNNININPISILRLDGDLYSSTKVVLENCYKYVAMNGYVIIDDYFWKPPTSSNKTKICKDAVDEFISQYNISMKQSAKSEATFWQKQ
eukprot:15862_1